MRSAITHWSNLLTQLFSFMANELNIFFITSGGRNDGGFQKDPKETLHKIPRLGR